MRMLLSIAATFALLATGPAFAGGAFTVDRFSTRAVTFGIVGQLSALEAASHATDA